MAIGEFDASGGTGVRSFRYQNMDFMILI